MPKSNVSEETRHNGRLDIERESRSGRPLVRSRFRALVQDFSPIWFTWCMNSGIIGILLNRHPYAFEGIRTLSIIAFCIDLLLYIIFSVIFILRFVMFGAEAFKEITSDMLQLCLVACWSIGYLTLPPLVSFLVTDAYWGGRWAMILAYVMWWFGFGFTIAVLAFVFIIIARRHLAGGDSNTHENPMPTMIVIPAVALATLAVTGAEVTSYSNFMNSRLAIPIIIAGFPLVCFAIVMGIFLETVLFRQLLEGGYPPPEQITSLFIYIGPWSQGGAAIVALGRASSDWFRQYDSGMFITEQAATVMSTICTMSSLMLLGPAVYFLLFSIYALIDCAISTRKVSWTPGWNAIIFPSATITTLTTFLSIELDSPFFKVVTSIQLVALVIVYFVNVAFTLTGIFKGELLIVREDHRVKQELEDQKEK